jgi:hypothetical protein
VQADFQARLDWCVAERYEMANHAPVAVLDGDRSRDVLHWQAKAGEQVTLSAAGSSDSDSEKIGYRWFIYLEPSDLADDVVLASMEGVVTSFTMPRNDMAAVHVVLQVSDNGSPPLSVFRRVVVSIAK